MNSYLVKNINLLDDKMYRIICFGDSITKGYHSRFKKMVIELYSEYNPQVINAGIAGETSVDGLKRLDSVIEFNPNVVIIGFGMNDWRKGVNIEVFKNNVEFMIDEFKKRDIRTILLTINPDAYQKNQISKPLIQYNQEIKTIAYRKKLRIADVYSLWLKELPNVEMGLYDEIHPNEHVGNKIICTSLLQIIFRTQTVVVWAFNGLYPFCNYKCEYCYVHSTVNAGHYFCKDLTMDEWKEAFRSIFGNEKIIFYLSYGEPMLSQGFYNVLEMIADEPKWYGHITSNLSVPLERLVNTKLVKEGRFYINASFHPTQVKIEIFLKKLLFLRKKGIECPIVLVAHPIILQNFEYYINYFKKYNFLVHVRRFKGWYAGEIYPKNYSEEERNLIAKYCDDATIRYMLNESTVDLRGKLSYEGMYYILVDEKGDVWTSPDSKSKYLGNVFKKNVKLFTEPQPYKVRWNGSVNGVAALLETKYKELSGNFVLSFAKQGGVYKTNSGIIYKNLNTDFTNLNIKAEYGFPGSKKKTDALHRFFSIIQHNWNSLTHDFITRKIYPIAERSRRKIIKNIYTLFS